MIFWISMALLWLSFGTVLGIIIGKAIYTVNGSYGEMDGDKEWDP